MRLMRSTQTVPSASTMFSSCRLWRASSSPGECLNRTDDHVSSRPIIATGFHPEPFGASHSPIPRSLGMPELFLGYETQSAPSCFMAPSAFCQWLLSSFWLMANNSTRSRSDLSDFSCVTPAGSFPSEKPVGAFTTASRMPGLRWSFFVSTRVPRDFVMNVRDYGTLQLKLAASFALPVPL